MMKPHSRWLVGPADERDAEVRLICFPHAGGGASMFHPWRATLRPDIAVYGVQLPGREDRFRESPVRSLDEILGSITAALSSLDDRPFVMFGHSMGAILAFEVARRLRRDGRVRPSALLVSGRGAPHLPSRAPRIAHLPAPEVVRRIAERHGGIPAAVLNDAALTDLMGRALQEDLVIIEEYEYLPDEPLECPILAFGGADDVWVRHNELDAWRQHTQGRFSCAQFHGDHFYFRTGDVMQLLLARVRESCMEVALHSSWKPTF